MNEFNVKTPYEWKENLYRKTTEKKAIRPSLLTFLSIILNTVLFLFCILILSQKVCIIYYNLKIF